MLSQWRACCAEVWSIQTIRGLSQGCTGVGSFGSIVLVSFLAFGLFLAGRVGAVCVHRNFELLLVCGGFGISESRLAERDSLVASQATDDQKDSKSHPTVDDNVLLDGKAENGQHVTVIGLSLRGH